MVGPGIENAIETQDRVELIVIGNATEPEGSFLRVERIVGHDDGADARHLEDARNVRFESLISEKVSGFGECRAVCGKSERVKDSDDAASGFGDGRVFDEERTPDGFGLLRFREGPIVLGGHAGGTEEFRFEVVVGEELIYSPEREFAESGSEEMSMDVNDGD